MEIYLDNAATTKPCPQAVSAVMEALTDNWGNPSAVHQLGLRAEKAVKHAREQVAHAMGCNPEQLFFTSGFWQQQSRRLLKAAVAKVL